MSDRQTDMQMERQTDGWTDRFTDRGIAEIKSRAERVFVYNMFTTLTFPSVLKYPSSKFVD